MGPTCMTDTFIGHSSLSLFRVKENGDGPVVHRGHLHIRPEPAVFHLETPLAALVQKRS